VIEAGPMLTRPNGYPLDSWGSDGFGIGCADEACVKSTIDRLVAHGARVIKLAGDDDGLASSLFPVAVAAAHAHGVKVAIHALSNASALAAARAGVDVLAHTPVEPLDDATVQAWKGRAVISTLAAFGGSPAAVQNLAKLRGAGATVLYGTDLGNTRDAGPSADEVKLLRDAGLDDAAICDSMTTAPLAFWNVSAGPTVGREATFELLDGDPRRDAGVLLHPRAVYVRGKRLR
jgi:imidazolonepropionase-like amidohydrolase